MMPIPMMTSSDKVHNFNLKFNQSKTLKLPKEKYGPLCLKIIKEFIAFYNLPKDLPVPCPGPVSYTHLTLPTNREV